MGRPASAPVLESPSGESDLLVGDALTDLVRTVWLRQQGVCRDLGLTMAQTRLMIAVGEPRLIPPAELARALDLSPQAMSSAMKHLEAEGLISRTRSVNDRRRVPAAFTTRGLRLYRRLQQRTHQFHAHLNGRFTGPDRVRAVRVLRTITDEIQGPHPVRPYRCALCRTAPARRKP